jgi:hypothetical protein
MEIYVCCFRVKICPNFDDENLSQIVSTENKLFLIDPRFLSSVERKNRIKIYFVSMMP